MYVVLNGAEGALTEKTLVVDQARVTQLRVMNGRDMEPTFCCHDNALLVPVPSMSCKQQQLLAIACTCRPFGCLAIIGPPSAGNALWAASCMLALCKCALSTLKQR
jgi:hypothetical protein